VARPRLPVGDDAVEEAAQQAQHAVAEVVPVHREAQEDGAALLEVVGHDDDLRHEQRLVGGRGAPAWRMVHGALGVGCPQTRVRTYPSRTSDARTSNVWWS
jgi:hypothetical protein